MIVEGTTNEKIKMKIAKLIVVLVVLAQAMLLMGVARAGTINNPDIIVNGQDAVITVNSEDNWFTFALNNNGNIILATAMANGYDQEELKIYDSTLKLVRQFYDFYTANMNLDSGKYIMQFAGIRTGTFTFSSAQLIPGSGMPSPDYLAGYNAGYEVGEQEGGFYVIPFPVPAK